MTLFDSLCEYLICHCIFNLRWQKSQELTAHSALSYQMSNNKWKTELWGIFIIITKHKIQSKTGRRYIFHFFLLLIKVKRNTLRKREGGDAERHACKKSCQAIQTVKLRHRTYQNPTSWQTWKCWHSLNSMSFISSNPFLIFMCIKDGSSPSRTQILLVEKRGYCKIWIQTLLSSTEYTILQKGDITW